MGLLILIVLVLCFVGGAAQVDHYSDDPNPMKRVGIPILAGIGAVLGAIALLTLASMFGGALAIDRDKDEDR